MVVLYQHFFLSLPWKIKPPLKFHHDSNTASKGGGGLSVTGTRRSEFKIHGALFENNSVGCNGVMEGKQGGAIKLCIRNKYDIHWA